MAVNKNILKGLILIGLLVLFACGKYSVEPDEMKKSYQFLKETTSFRYPLDDYFPETPVTDQAPPKGEKHHTAEDSFAPAGTPVYAIGDGIVRYSGKAGGYGWLIIIDHPLEDVYSLYGHLSPNKWKKDKGQVKKGELIAYLGTAKEGETSEPHIHFGLRKGQKKDYPLKGDARWMAGYTKVRPELLGWFKPSEVIGQTDSMKAWHTYIRKREDAAPSRKLSAVDFRITEGMYNEKDNLDLAIQEEFGSQYRLADWNEVVKFYDTIEEWADSIGMKKGGDDEALLVSYDGYRIWLKRQYFISRFNHDKPPHFLAHASIYNDFICLGSWGDLKMHILAVKK